MILSLLSDYSDPKLADDVFNNLSKKNLFTINSFFYYIIFFLLFNKYKI